MNTEESVSETIANINIHSNIKAINEPTFDTNVASIPPRLKLLSVQDVSLWLQKNEYHLLVSLFQKQQITGFSLALIRNETDLIGYGLDLRSVGLSEGNIEDLLECIDQLRINDISDDQLATVSSFFAAVFPCVSMFVCLSVCLCIRFLNFMY